jgi:hypothetical protein
MIARPAERPDATIWGKRIWTIIAAMGWPEEEWAGHFGKSAEWIKRALWGRRRKRRDYTPVVKADAAFVIRLRKLEIAYEREIEAFKWFKIKMREAKPIDEKRYVLRLPVGWVYGDPLPHGEEPLRESTEKQVAATFAAFEARRSGSCGEVDWIDRKLAEERIKRKADRAMGA